MVRCYSVRSRVALGFLCLAVCGPAALAQSGASAFPPALNTEQNPLQNVSAGALAGRSPGNMVSAGVARTLAAADFGRTIIEITEQPPGPDPKATFLAEAVKEIFDQINRALILFENVLRLRAGLPPRVPVGIPIADENDDATDTTPSLSDLAGLLGGA